MQSMVLQYRDETFHEQNPADKLRISRKSRWSAFTIGISELDYGKFVSNP